MSILSHPSQPGNRNWKLLADFTTGSAELREDHRQWLIENVIPVLCGDRPGWVFIRGFASNRGEENMNMDLSRRRANAVHAFILENECVNPSHISAIEAVGETRGPSDSRNNNDERWRSVEIIVTNAAQPVPIPGPTRPVPRTIRLIQRRVNCVRVDSHPSTRLAADRQGSGEEISEMVHYLMDLRNPDRSIACQVQGVPDNHRINRILIRDRSTDTGNTSSSATLIDYEWGIPTPNTVLVDSRGTVPFRKILTREEIRALYRTPGRVLANGLR